MKKRCSKDERLNIEMLEADTTQLDIENKRFNLNLSRKWWSEKCLKNFHVILIIRIEKWTHI